MVAVSEVYVDESGSHDGSPVLCVAGYLFKRSKAVELSEAWQRVLDRYEVPYARMSELAPGRPPFDRLSLEQRIKMEKALIKIIRQTMTYGFSITVPEDQYNQIIPYDHRLGGAYSFCLRQCLIAVNSWATRTAFDGQIAYFFESGHRDQTEANGIMHKVFAVDALRERYRYVSHTFADKKKLLPLQAADLLAWLWFTDSKHRLNGRNEARKDVMALIRGSLHDTPQPYETMLWTNELLSGLVPTVQQGLLLHPL